MESCGYTQVLSSSIDGPPSSMSHHRAELLAAETGWIPAATLIFVSSIVSYGQALKPSLQEMHCLPSRWLDRESSIRSTFPMSSLYPRWMRRPPMLMGQDFEPQGL
eukprot:m.22164 g.22164  ORF g.22164 m.22164 type:complete len:106 (+) comp11212_c0_seq6:131-448(+)